MKIVILLLGCALCLSTCSGQEQEAVQDDQQAGHADESSGNVEKEGDHALLSGFTVEDSSWKIVWHGSSDVDLLNAPDMESILMLTKDNEQYNCQVESVKKPNEEEDASYDGPNPLQLMEPLFNKLACSYRLESYWTYEVCHGDYVRQYHETKEGKQTKLIEYYLGRYSKETLQTEVEEWDAALKSDPASRRPRTLRLEEIDLPYLETLVRYVCHAAGRHEVVSFQETSSCQYVIVVLSPLLCAHPDYRVTADVEHLIHCIALSNSPKRPRSLLELEAQSLALRHGLRPVDGAPAAVPAPAAAPAAAAAEDGPDPDTTPVDAEPPPITTARPLAVYDEKLVEDFLAGRHCLNGGTGWWRYEFCHGKRVDQYHVNRDGTRTVIHLGFFSRDVHREWLTHNPQKRPRPAAGRRHVSHFYSGGSMCDEISAPRSVEVKLKCKQSESPNAVSLYLLEPRPCQYILGVESPIVCRLVEQANDDGLIDE
ncbi:Endoplasmic reticulum lectin 1 [Amphibalanus amphitrite]|uniref:Endoplasmic reticulum lectin 1 n=1 Tax=Amphibalanus amphitrite TaxID=1232801 RepID=A0A6A4VGT3_AMPAM|nr:Endoplasmic reticulum lectin 1 [Amphibalanus amphitrite]